MGISCVRRRPDSPAPDRGPGQRDGNDPFRERVGAEHALRIGLVNRIWPQAELLTRSMDYAQMLARRSPLSHRFAKEVMKRAIGMPMDEALRLESRSFYDVGFTEDLAEGTTSFRERRDADFKGR